jgi:ABC-type Fe3+/spermidine/putrescine transport system ATPase subunit|tara:strand:- start:133 stop:1077 length:945 start_codon:yes stop_codon:yes gene_type:complete
MWRLHQLAVQFDGKPAIENFSAQFDKNQITVILGPSGSGKSTLLRVIAGLHKPDSGQFFIDDVDATELPSHQRDIGLMFQDHTLFPHRNVSQNVEFGLRLKKIQRKTRRIIVDEMLKLVGLEGFNARDVSSLSGGEAQRVALARALAPRPSLLLLDEPLGALDRPLRDRLTHELPKVLRTTKTSAIHVTHDHDEAFAIADKLIVMDSAKALRIGSPMDVYNDPRSETVAKFLGHSNFVKIGDQKKVIGPQAASIDPNGNVPAVVTDVRLSAGLQETFFATSLGPLKFRLKESLSVDTSTILQIDLDQAAQITSS